MATPKRRKHKRGQPTTTSTYGFRMSDKYSMWLDEFATYNRSTVAGLIDQALAAFAKSTGFKEPPERA